MIILNCTGKIFRIWFKESILIFLFFLLMTGMQSCHAGKDLHSGKDADSLKAGKTIPGGPSVSPNCFRAEAKLLNARVDAANEKMIYSLLVQNVLERGSSLILPVAIGDSIQTVSELSSIKLQQNDEVNVMVEERMQVASEMPLFILRSIRKK